MSDVISRHAMSHETFADDTQVHQSAPIDEIGGLMARTRECISDLKVWMTQNKLQLNDEKTELLLACPKKFLNHPSLPTVLEISNTTVPFFFLCPQSWSYSRSNPFFSATHLKCLQKCLLGTSED